MHFCIFAFLLIDVHVEGTKVGKVNEDECNKIVEMIQVFAFSLVDVHVEGTKVGKVNEDECDKIVEMIQDLIAKLDGYEDECDKFVEMIIFHMALASSLWWEANRVDLFELKDPRFKISLQNWIWIWGWMW